MASASRRGRMGFGIVHPAKPNSVAEAPLRLLSPPCRFRNAGGSDVLTLLGNPRQCCDGLSRRELMRIGALSLFGGLVHPRLASSATRNPHESGKARSVILLDLFGG